MSARGERDGGCKNQRTSHPRVRTEMVPKKLYAKPGTQRGLNVQKDSGARSGYMMDAPVP